MEFRVQKQFIHPHVLYVQCRYLVPSNWSAADGGALDLFSVDANGQADEVAKSYIPVSQRASHSLSVCMSSCLLILIFCACDSHFPCTWDSDLLLLCLSVCFVVQLWNSFLFFEVSPVSWHQVRSLSPSLHA